MNPELLLNLLLPIVKQLGSLLTAIKQNHPKEWAQISPEFQSALDDLKAATPP